MHSDASTISIPKIWREASCIVYEEGFRAFWKGNLVTIVHRLPYSLISFYAYERYKIFLQLVPSLDKQGDYIGAKVCVRLLGGGLAGVTATSITYPLDLVRTRLAAQVGNVHVNLHIVPLLAVEYELLMGVLFDLYILPRIL